MSNATTKPLNCTSGIPLVKRGKTESFELLILHRFKTITATYYKGANGIILVYDITDRQSFIDIENWLNEIQTHASPNVTKILVGNKSDLEDDRQVSYQEGKEFAEKLGMEFLETSAKTRVNIDESFMKLTKAILPTVPVNKKKEEPGKIRF